ncbi:MAG: hypothetical protein KF829_09345 [Ferruginibacter sp.]|nr:hypothetical protein [Ferruginibacter sp.]
MKNFFSIIFLLPFISYAQNNKIVVDGVSGGQHYIIHKTAPKENFYSIGRLYNISPRVYAPFNNLDVDTSPGLGIGQDVKIPLVETNFTQNPIVSVEEVFVPVYHKVLAKETLNIIGQQFNGVAAAELIRWNKLLDNNIKPGDLLIIGYLKVKPELSSLAQQAIKIPTNTESVLTVSNEREKASIVKSNVQDQTISTQPREAEKQVKDGAQSNQRKEGSIDVQVKEQKRADAPVSVSNPQKFSGGKFKDVYSAQINGRKITEKSVTAGFFKSTSGWSDGKYYCFNNEAQAGSILKITNRTSNKTIYAKVLDVMPDISQNDGIDLRISNAGADELGITTDTFDVTIAY